MDRIVRVLFVEHPIRVDSNNMKDAKGLQFSNMKNCLENKEASESDKILASSGGPTARYLQRLSERIFYR